MLGDREVSARAPTLIDDGVPGCALSRLRHDEVGWIVAAIASTKHLLSLEEAFPD